MSQLQPARRSLGRRILSKINNITRKINKQETKEEEQNIREKNTTEKSKPKLTEKVGLKLKKDFTSKSLEEKFPKLSSAFFVLQSIFIPY